MELENIISKKILCPGLVALLMTISSPWGCKKENQKDSAYEETAAVTVQSTESEAREKLYLGINYGKESKRAEAIREIYQAKQLDSTDPVIRNDLGVAYAQAALYLDVMEPEEREKLDFLFKDSRCPKDLKGKRTFLAVLAYGEFLIAMGGNSREKITAPSPAVYSAASENLYSTQVLVENIKADDYSSPVRFNIINSKMDK